MVLCQIHRVALSGYGGQFPCEIYSCPILAEGRANCSFKYLTEASLEVQFSWERGSYPVECLYSVYESLWYTLYGMCNIILFNSYANAKFAKLMRSRNLIYSMQYRLVMHFQAFIHHSPYKSLINRSVHQ